MRIAIITRSTLYNVPGGDTVQVVQTSAALRAIGIDTDIILTTDKIDYDRYDLFHFTNITRPADILYHTRRAHKPYVVSPLLVDYSEYDSHHRHGLSGWLLRQLPTHLNEYTKTVARWAVGRDSIRSKSYILKGQRNSIREIIKKAAMVLPNSGTEYEKLYAEYGIAKEYSIVPNGIDTSLFHPNGTHERDNDLVLCAARIEGIKNQLNLVIALNNTRFKLVLVGSYAPNQKRYYETCRKAAAPNVEFHDHVPQDQLAGFYKKAKVHVLPSWFETCGLSSLEAAAMGCNIVVTAKGFTREYFGDDAIYCDPGDTTSILKSIEFASGQANNKSLQERISSQFTWQRAAAITAAAYKKVLH
jgi:glycosyltransferase involved in cell wall biosynthesis